MVFANRIEQNSSPTTPTVDLSEYAAPSEDPSCDETDTAEDNYDGIDWNRLPNLQKPSQTSKRKASWIYKYGYRCQNRKNPDLIIWVCRYCHQHKITGRGQYNVTNATSAAANHLKQRSRGHGYNEKGIIEGPSTRGGQLSVIQSLQFQGVNVPQRVANEIEGFDGQAFRDIAVSWVVENNHPLREFETEAFRAMIKAANPLAEAALYKNHESVKQHIMNQYRALFQSVKLNLANSITKIHFTFDGWTSKGGKRAFTGICVHHINEHGQIVDYPLALPSLSGVHSGERIGHIVQEIIDSFGIPRHKIGYFVLDNAHPNNTALEFLAAYYGFRPRHRRLRCGPHILNLVAQVMMFGIDKESFENDEENLPEEEIFLKEWREEGPLGTLCDVLNYIKTPQQYEKLELFQIKANERLPVKDFKPKSIVKPVKTRWNSYYKAFVRATEIQEAIDSYIEYYIEQYQTEVASKRARRRNAKEPDAPHWMKGDGLTGNDWQTINKYVEFLKPLEEATHRLEGKGKSGRFGALYEVIPTFDCILAFYEAEKDRLSEVDYETEDAPEDHYKTSINLGWEKLSKYWDKLDESPAYYAATLLHPQYKFYCQNAWADKPTWLLKFNQSFQELWATYRDSTAMPAAVRPPKRAKILSAIDEHIAQFTRQSTVSTVDDTDEYERWRHLDSLPRDHSLAKNPIQYWLDLRVEYPVLSQMALDILTIPGSSADCERVFSELGDLLEPRRLKMKPATISAIQCTRAWAKKGFKPRENSKWI